MKSFKKPIKNFIHTSSALFISGFLTLLPFTITYSIFAFSFKVLKNLFEPLTILQDKIPYVRDIPHAEIILALVLIILAGVFLKSFIIQSLFNLFEYCLTKVPFIRPVYKSTKQLVNAFSPKDNEGLKKVVLVEFPLQGNFAIGFQTSNVPASLAPAGSTEYVGVLIPTSPSPTNGFFIMVKKDSVQPLDITPQEAMALVISGGIVYPQKSDSTQSTH